MFESLSCIYDFCRYFFILHEFSKACRVLVCKFKKTVFVYKNLQLYMERCERADNWLNDCVKNIFSNAKVLERLYVEAGV